MAVDIYLEAVMAKRSFMSTLRAIERAGIRQQRQDAINARRRQREYERSVKAQLKQDKEDYLQAKLDEESNLNKHLKKRKLELASILNEVLNAEKPDVFAFLKFTEKKPTYKPPVIFKNLKEPIIDDYIKNVKKPSVASKLIPGWKVRQDKALAEAESKYQQAKAVFEKDKSTLDDYESNYANEVRNWQEKSENAAREITELKEKYERHDFYAVVYYNALLLKFSKYPEGFPQEFRIAYETETTELVVEYQLPLVDIIPQEESYKYVKSKDEMTVKKEKVATIKDLYQDVISSICLRTLSEIFRVDLCDSISSVVFNGYVKTFDPATGKDIKPHIISVRTTKDSFLEIDLSRIDKKACLRNLGGHISPHPAEMQAVKPIIEFDMIDKRFVEQQNVLSELDSRPNLMDLNPFEFENLVANLFSKMGLETKQTRTSKDGGVDAIAYDNRPILGGKVVIQAKRYKNIVGVSFVRDLYGTMMNEGANKGILVTTSHYGRDAYEFAKDKPIELIDGGGLLHYLNEVGINAKIIFPEDNNVS
jgi:restriction system protein